MLTVLDIIHLIQYYYKTAVTYDNVKTDVEKFRLESLRGAGRHTQLFPNLYLPQTSRRIWV